MQANVTTQRIAWSLGEISDATGLSLGFLRNDVRRGTLPTKKFGRRVLVLDEDLKNYLSKGESPNANGNHSL
jgi:excisionase family DNA binding protein